MILTKNVCSFLTEVTSSAGSEYLQLYLKNFNVETELRQPISPSQRLCVTFLYFTGDVFVGIGTSLPP